MTTEARTRAAPSPSRQAIPRNDRHHALQWLCAERVRRAQDLLENTDDTIERIAALCGFGSAHQLRTHFSRINRVTPHAYQRNFRSRAAA